MKAGQFEHNIGPSTQLLFTFTWNQQGKYTMVMKETISFNLASSFPLCPWLRHHQSQNRLAVVSQLLSSLTNCQCSKIIVHLATSDSLCDPVSIVLV